MNALNPAKDTATERAFVSEWGQRAGFYLFVALVAGGMAGAWLVRDARYLLPESGLGYALGITGCTLMLLLLIYPMRKRMASLQSWWTVAAWFRLHMLLGVLGPCLILLHCNFSLGSTNSSVALLAMLLVAGSGLIGRYLYGQCHNGIYGEQIKLEQLQRDMDSVFRGIPEQQKDSASQAALEGLHQGCQQIVSSQQQRLSMRQLLAQRKWLRNRQKLVKRLEEDLPAVVSQLRKLDKLMGKLAGLALFERLFSIWHVVHLPVFALMVITAIVHIFVVHWY